MITNRQSFAGNVVRRQSTLPIPQIRPTLLDFGEPKRMQPLCLNRITSAQAEFLFTPPDEVAKIIRNTFPEPIKTTVGMLPGTTHRKGHVYHPCVPIGRQKAYGNQWPVDFAGFLVPVAEREGFEPPIGLHLCRISSAVHSTTLPPLQAQIRANRAPRSGRVLGEDGRPDKARGA